MEAEKTNTEGVGKMEEERKSLWSQYETLVKLCSAHYRSTGASSNQTQQREDRQRCEERQTETLLCYDFPFYWTVDWEETDGSR